MKNKTIIYIACIVAIALTIAFAIYFVVTANKGGNSESKEKIVITKYDENFEVEKEVEITNKKQIKEINKICENPSLEQDDVTVSLGIGRDVKVDLGNGKLFFVQLDLPINYCYYEDANSNTKLVIKMPEGLLEKVNIILGEN